MLRVLLVLLAAWPPHPQSHSTSLVRVEGRDVSLEVRCQAASLLAAIGPAADADGDGRLDADELLEARPAVERYLAGAYRVSATDASGAAKAVALHLEALEPAPSPTGVEEPWVDVLLRGETDAPPLVLEAEVTLFRERDPLHRDVASVEWAGEAPRVFVTGADVTRWSFEPAARRRPGVIATFLRLGVGHILSGWDHLAFLLALLLAARRLRSLLATITAFTAAHSITLALAALGVVHVPGRPVELAIALSIAYVALENLLVPRTSSRWVEAFVFGLVHGLGFAGFLGESLVAEPLKLSALIGFNLGVELGQLAVVVPLSLFLWALPGARRRAESVADAPPVAVQVRGSLAPLWARHLGSACVAVAGLWWFLGRAGWV